LRLRLGAEHGLALLKTRRDLTFLAVTSKSQELVDADLAALGLGSPRVVVAVDAWGIGTAPRDLTVVCSEQRLSTDSSVFVCDHPRDVIEAHAAGLTAAVLANGHPVEPSVLAEQPEHVLATLADLPPMLG
jgi:phosphoglycolate phosphatase-like HAD superfamily hydrolase